MRVSRPGFDNHESRHTIFFALYPPFDKAASIARYLDSLFESGLLRGARIARECLHISLNGLGAYASLPECLIIDACDAVSKLRLRSFRLSLNRLMSFDHKNDRLPFVLTGDDDGLPGVYNLSLDLHDVLTQARLMGRAKPCMTPHLTLSWEKTLLPERFIEPVIWDVREFRLIHSPRGESRHNVWGAGPGDFMCRKQL